MSLDDAQLESPNPFELYTAIWREAARSTELAGAAPAALEQLASVDVGETPSDVIYRENKLELLRYEPSAGPTQDLPVLITYALINRPYILDLQPDRSVIRQFLDAGFTVYLIDWDEPSRLDATLGLEDYVIRYMDNCVEASLDDADVETINLLGYCMGGTMSAMYASLFPEKVNALGLMAAGLCFEETGGILELWGDEDFFDPSVVTDTYGNVPSEFLDFGFALMDPVDNFVTKYLTFADNLDNEDFVANFGRMETWLGDGIDVAGRAYEQFLVWIYQENRLYEGTLELDGIRIDLDRIDMPVAQIIGEYDHLIPPESSQPFNEVIGSDDTTIFECATGHIGLSVSGRAHAELWPSVIDWYGTHATEVGLEDLDGVGPTYAAALHAAGIKTPEGLLDVDLDTVAESTDIPRGRLESIVDGIRHRG